MIASISRRQFAFLSAFGALSAGGYGVQRAVQRMRNAARRMADL